MKARKLKDKVKKKEKHLKKLEYKSELEMVLWNSVNTMLIQTPD